MFTHAAKALKNFISKFIMHAECAQKKVQRMLSCGKTFYTHAEHMR
jgi:hypothetical protein